MNTDLQTDTLIDIIRSRMWKMTDEERIDLMNYLMDGYCKYCGNKHLPCYCICDD